MDRLFGRVLSATLLGALFFAVTAAGQDCAPTASNGGPYCPGSTISLFATSPDPNATFSWTGPNDFKSSEQNPTIPNADETNAGTYTVSVDGCTLPPASTTVTVGTPPSTITGTPVWVTASSIGNTASGPAAVGSYSWKIDNGTITAGADAQDMTYTAGSAGTLTLTLTTTWDNKACSSTSSQTVEVDPQPTITIGDVQHAEGNSGYTAFNFPVKLSNPSSQKVTVQYYTSNSTALAGSDYVAVPLMMLTFNPVIDPTTKYVTVQVIGDTKKENNELFGVIIINPTNATLAAKVKGWGYILNDD